MRRLATSIVLQCVGLCSTRCASTTAPLTTAPTKVDSHIGKVLHWNAQLGFGTIASLNDGSRITVRRSDISCVNTADANLRIGTQVQFEVVNGSSTAKRVESIGGGRLPDVPRSEFRTSKPVFVGSYQALAIEHASPVNDVPWLMSHRATYLDNLQKLYGRKEIWSTLPNATLRRQLLMFLAQYINDMENELKRQNNKLARYSKFCKAYRLRHVQWVLETIKNPSILNRWTYWKMYPNEARDGTTRTKKRSDRQFPLLEGQKREDPARLGEPEPMRMLPDYHALPFLRRRAVEQPQSLDEALVGFAKQHFPKDSNENIDAIGSSQNPLPSQPMSSSPDEPKMESTDGKQTPQKPKKSTTDLHTSAKRKAKVIFPTWDGTGKYYSVSEKGRARPKKFSFGNKRNAVKIDWDTIEKTQYASSYDAMRARERKARLLKGEEPQDM